MKNHTTADLLTVAALLCTAAGMLHAQTIYRIVGADGKVTFSDKPPVNTEQGKIAGTGIGAAAANPATGLPLELRQVVAKYPVVLYTTSKCAPCDAGRAFLNGRGVPFNERTVTTNEDRDYLQRLSSDATLPYLTIGGQRIKGWSDQEWSQYLDAAGYPKVSVLPSTFKNTPPTPLVALQKTPEVAPRVEEKTAPPSSQPDYTPPTSNPANPAGITF